MLYYILLGTTVYFMKSDVLSQFCDFGAKRVNNSKVYLKFILNLILFLYY